MSIEQRIADDYIAALRGGDDVRKQTLRLLRSALRYARIDAGADLDDAGTEGVLRHQAKQRRDSIELFERGGRADLAAQERAELTVIESYLPARLSLEEIEVAAREQIAAAGATSIADIGKVMRPLMQSLGERVDGREVRAVVQRLLG